MIKMTQRLKNLSLIAATTEDGGIGANNSLPWACPEDMKWFVKCTTGKNVVMGYKTLESLDFRPLPKRNNYLIKGRNSENFKGILEYDYPCMLQIIKSKQDEEFVIIGGAKTYELFMPHVSKAYITTIDNKCVFPDAEIDTYMPPLPEAFGLQGVLEAHNNSCIVRCYTELTEKR